MARRPLPDSRLRRAVECFEHKRLYGEPKPEKPLYFRWKDVIAVGTDVGVKVGAQLAAKYIQALEESWGGKPTDKKDLTVACKWLVESTLEEAFTQPPWDSLKVIRLFYPDPSREAVALDWRVWQAFERAVVQTIHEWLVSYGCRKTRLLDMHRIVEYYKNRWPDVAGPGA